MNDSPKIGASTSPDTQQHNELAGNSQTSGDELVNAQLSESEIEVIRALSQRWGTLEPQLEALSNWDENLKDKLSAYIDDLRAEIKSLKQHRFWLVLLSIVVVILLLSVLICFLFYKSYFFTQGGYAGTALIVGVISAVVLILRASITSAFKTLKDRNDGDMSPKALLDVAAQARSVFPGQ